MTRRVGIFGGSFDPVHSAHLALAHAALSTLALEQVRWVPTGQAWHKEHEMTPAVHREAMVRLAAAGEPRFMLDRSEIERPGPSYTLDTVQALAAAQPDREWVLIIGQDQYAALHTWNHWQRLLELVTLAVANRPGPSQARALPALEVQAFAHRVVPLPMLDISSTDIRDRVRAGLSIRDRVPAAVADYIESQGLYRAAPAQPLPPPQRFRS